MDKEILWRKKIGFEAREKMRELGERIENGSEFQTE